MSAPECSGCSRLQEEIEDLQYENRDLEKKIHDAYIDGDALGCERVSDTLELFAKVLDLPVQDMNRAFGAADPEFELRRLLRP